MSQLLNPKQTNVAVAERGKNTRDQDVIGFGLFSNQSFVPY